MGNTQDIKQLERRVFTSFHGDGLFDLYVGVLMMVGPTATFLRDHGMTGIGPVAVHLVLVGLICGAYLLLKRHITIPRLGMVKFGPERRTRHRKIRLIMALALSVTFSLAAFTLAAANGIIDGVGNLFSNQIQVLGIVFGFQLAVFLGIAAYYLDFHRGYLVAIVMGAGIGGYVGFQSSASMVVGGLLLAMVGTIYLIRFLNTNPVIDINGQEGMHGIA